MIKRWRHCLDNSGAIAAVLMGLLKAYDCIPHDLLTAELYVYGLDTSAFNLLHSYLSNRKQRLKVNNSLSDWVNVVVGIPQGSGTWFSSFQHLYSLQWLTMIFATVLMIIHCTNAVTV